MKLSEAIRLGAMLKPQVAAGLHINGGTCAIGSALDAIGRLPADGDRAGHNDAYLLAQREWPLLQYRVKSPYDGRGTTLFYAIWDMNDTMGWTREQIAEFIEAIERERQQAIESAAPTNAVASPVEVA